MGGTGGGYYAGLGMGQGAIPSTSGGTSTSSGSSSGQSSTQMIPGMQGVYSQLLGMNQQNYGNVMNAYQGAQKNLGSNLPGVYQGYGALGNQIQNTLGMGQVLGKDGNWGVAQPAATAIGQAYQQQMGNTTQQMTNAGLGNTSAVGNAQNQNAQGAAQAYAGLGSQLAQAAAGYQAQTGLAGLAGQMQGLGMQTGLSQAALGPLGQQFANTAGSLTGGFSQSQSQQSGSSKQSSQGGQQGNNSGGGGSLAPGTGGSSIPHLGGSSYAGAGVPSMNTGVPSTNVGGPNAGVTVDQSTSATKNNTTYPADTTRNNANYPADTSKADATYPPNTNKMDANGYPDTSSANANYPADTSKADATGYPTGDTTQEGLQQSESDMAALQQMGATRAAAGVSPQPPYPGAQPTFGVEGSENHKVLIGWH